MDLLLFLKIFVVTCVCVNGSLNDENIISYHIESWSFIPTSEAPLDLINAMNETCTLKFTTLHHSFSLDLSLFTGVYGEHSRIYAKDENGNEIELEVQYRSYHSNKVLMIDLDENKTYYSDIASVTFYSDGRFHASIEINNDLYTVDLIDIRKHIIDNIGTNNNHRMTMTVLKDESMALNRRKLQTLYKFSNCFSGQWSYDVHYMYIGIVTDTYYNALFGHSNSQVQSSVEAIFSSSQVNYIFYDQMNIYLFLGTFYIGYSPYVDLGSLSLGYDPGTRLSFFANFRNQYYSNNGGGSGVGGIAYLNAICNKNNGVGVSNFFTGGWETYLVFAHEVGHNFGGNHAFQEGQGSTGGVMDYADFRYPLGYGRFQFHPVYNQNEMCAQITSSKYENPTCSWLWPWQTCPDYRSNSYNLIPLSQCWKYGNWGRRRLQTVSNSSNSDYSWIFVDKHTSCFPNCGEYSYKQKIYKCYFNSVTLVDESNCDVSIKPNEYVKCNISTEVPTCSNVCGDGILSFNELCDNNLESCCNSNCDGYINSNVLCLSENRIIDASFVDSNDTLYLFQGEYYSRYYYDYGKGIFKIDYNFPKLINVSFPINSWTGNFSSIAYLSDSKVYVFKGLEYTILDLDSGEFDGYPRVFHEDFNVPSDIISCGNIEASIALQYFFVVFCKSIYGYVAYHNNSENYNVYTISQFIDTDIEDMVVSTFYFDNYVYLYSKTSIFRSFISPLGDIINDYDTSHDHVLDDIPTNIFSNLNITSTDLIVNNSCNDENCRLCYVTDLSYCISCIENYVLYDNTKCLNNLTLLYLDMNYEDENSIDYYFVIGGKATLGNYIYYDTGVTGGNYHQSMFFDKSTQLNLYPLNIHNQNKTITQFEISLRFKPYSIDNDIFFTVDYGMVQIVFYNNTENVTFIKFHVGNDTFIIKSSNGNNLVLNEWNTVILKYYQETFIALINEDKTISSYQSSVWNDFFIRLTISNWYIGDSAGNGIHGEIDQVKFKVLESKYYIDQNSISSETDVIIKTKEKRNKTWFIIGTVFVVLFTVLCLAVIGFALWFYKDNKFTQLRMELTKSPKPLKEPVEMHYTKMEN